MHTSTTASSKPKMAKAPCLSCLLLLLLLAITTSASTTLPTTPPSYEALFDAWCSEHGKAYATAAERAARLAVFADNAAFVAAHNAAPNASYRLALNAFADLTHEEFRAARLGGLADAAAAGEGPAALRRVPFVGYGGAVPKAVDWRKSGAVTAVKDQGQCGACWSFSATGAMEGINKITTGSLVSLSEQELIDCDRSYNKGCSGGLMDYAYMFVIQNNGIDTEEDYPYRRADGICNRNKLKRRVVTIDGYTDVPRNSDDMLLKAVAKQPVSVGICGSARAFQLYSEGIFNGPCPTSLDHAVLIVGYSSEGGKDYWIVKNSWGESWGMSGYMHLRRNTGNPSGVCGVNRLPSFPTKTSPNPPPSPSPGPTRCSLMTYCPEGTTCCCTWRLLGFCLSWSCCELNNAVCCKDHRYCCPHDYPICDTINKQCWKGVGNSSSIQGIERKQSFTKVGPWNGFLELLEQ